MKIDLSEKTKADIAFLDDLSRHGIINYPIDYETNRQTFTETSETLDLWLGGSKWRTTGHKFLQLGEDACGSLFCLWFYPELKGEPPVIFLGSEGETSLVSNNAHDFLKQITSGKLFYEGDWLTPDDEEKGELDWELLSQKVKSYVDALCSDPAELTKLAYANHPDIFQWVEKNIE